MAVNNKKGQRGLWTSCALAATLLLGQASVAQTNTIVRVSTSYGDFSVELYGDAAPQNVQNFLNYVRRGAYAGSYFHRLDKTDNNVLQGGGYTFQPWVGPIAIPADPPVPLEYNLPNVRGSIGVARTPEPNSATSQWYINLADNTEPFGPNEASAGYTVMGAVLGDGMNVVDAISELTPRSLGATHPQTPLRNYPNEDNIVRSENLVLMNAEVTYRYSEAVSVFEYQSTLLFTSVTVNGGEEMYTLNLSLVPDPEKIIFRLNPETMVPLQAAIEGMSTFSTSDNLLRIPSVEVNDFGLLLTLNNVVLRLTDPATWEFTVESYDGQLQADM